MDIKEIALRLLAEDFPGMRQENQAFMVEFAEALIESYKAELLKEVGESVAEVIWFDPALELFPSKQPHKIIDGSMSFMDSSKIGTKFYTSDQVVAAIEKAEQRVAEACALQVATETKFHWLDAARVAKEIRSGEWRKFVKEV